MKQPIRFVAVILLFSLFVTVFAGCQTREQKIYDKVYAHLNRKYQDIEFQINGYVQDTQTSGKYTFDVTCITTGVDFEVIMTSLFMSDSYFVSHANKNINDEVFEVLGAAAPLVRLDEVVCFDPYMDDSGTYRFNENVELTSKTLMTVDSLHRVKLTGVESSDDAAQCIYMFCDVLKIKGAVFSSVKFEFILNGESVRFETETDTITALDNFVEIRELLDEAKSPAALGELFYREPESDIKVIPFFAN